MKQIIEAVRQLIRGWVRVFARSLNKLTCGRLHPDAVTIVGLLMHVPIAVLLATEYWLAAAVLLVIFGLFDTLDGELARMQDRVTNSGGFLDASTDRIKEVVLYIGAAYYLTLSVHPKMAVWAVAACGASLTVSYIKAKGEAVIASQSKKLPYAELNKLFADGLMPSEIRMTLLIAGLLSGQLVWAIAIIAILATYTVLQRLVNISRALRL